MVVGTGHRKKVINSLLYVLGAKEKFLAIRQFIFPTRVSHVSFIVVETFWVYNVWRQICGVHRKWRLIFWVITLHDSLPSQRPSVFVWSTIPQNDSQLYNYTQMSITHFKSWHIWVGIRVTALLTNAIYSPFHGKQVTRSSYGFNITNNQSIVPSSAMTKLTTKIRKDRVGMKHRHHQVTTTALYMSWRSGDEVGDET